MDKNKCPYFDSSKKFLKFFLCFFTFLFLRIIYKNCSFPRNVNKMEKVVQSIRKKWKKWDFSDIFRIFSEFKKWKKRVNGPKKTSISAFFHVFWKMKACAVWRFLKIKRSFFSVHFWTVFHSRGDALAPFWLFHFLLA